MDREASLTLRNSFTMCLAGPTGCGKTVFLDNMIRNADTLFSKKPGPVYYFYKLYQDKFRDMESYVNFVEGMCTMDWIRANVKEGQNTVLILDDLARNMSEDTSEIFSVASHHMDCNVCLVVHNLFDKNKAFRNISLNSRYLVVFKNPRDTSSITAFAKQFDPGNAARMMRIYRDATAKPFSHLFVDLDQKTPENLRLRSNIFFDHDEPMRIFVRN